VKSLKVAILAGALVLAGGNSPNWNATVTEQNQGHVIGNPEAENTLTEYVSYTCGHCAQFARQGDPVIKLVFVHPGDLKLEIRHLLRDPIDLTAAMLTHCGAESKFPLNHSAFMTSQASWLGKAQNATQAQMQRWSNPDRAAARRALASDLDFYELMEQRGYGRSEIDQCLNDNAKADALVETTVADVQRLGLTGTPSFLLNEKLLEGVHSWQALEPHLTGKAQPAHQH
jgi:protein-disulfide isomerase